MNDLIIISTFASTLEKQVVLINLLNQLKKTKKEVLVVSHHPVSAEIQKLCSYFIYDHRDELIGEEYYLRYNKKGWHQFWYNSDELQYLSNLNCSGQHSYSIYQNFQSALSFAKNLNKDFIYYLEYDNILADQDIEGFEEIRRKLQEEGKKAYFEEVPSWRDAISAVFFCGELDFLINIFQRFASIEEYVSKFENDFIFEWAFRRMISPHKEQVLIGITDTDASAIFPNSRINVFDFKENPGKHNNSHANIVLGPEKKGPPILVVFNNKPNTDYFILIKSKDKCHWDSKINLGEEQVFFKYLDFIDLEYGEIEILVFIESYNSLLFSYKLNKNNVEQLADRGEIRLKN